MNQRAFNLFTALVAFVLIMLTILLVQSMLGSEDTVVSTIAKLESQSKLYAVAHVTRADALQIFNYFVRYWVEDHLTGGGGYYRMDDPNVLRDWDELQKDYATTYFGGGSVGGDQFARQLALNLRSYFRATTSFGNYTMKLEDRDVDMSYFENPNNADPLKEVIKNTLNESVQTNEFFEVIGCEDGNPENCDPGTFYITFEGSKITDKAYEEVPVLKIVDNSTNEFVKIGIIPRHDLRIYVPLRLFKALAIARDAALDYETRNNLSQNYGLLAPRVHNEIEEMKLGFCDKGYCAPRTNPYMPPDAKEWDSKCNGTSSVKMNLSNTPYFTEPEWNEPNKPTYELVLMPTTLAELVRKRVCDITALNDTLNDERYTTGDFIISESDSLTICGMPSKLSDLTVEVTPRTSKQIHDSGGAKLIKSKGTTQKAVVDYDPALCPMTQNTLLYDNPNAALFWKDGKIQVIQPPVDCSPSTSETAKCAEVTQVTAELIFVENNPKYKVVNSNVVQFQVKIVDNRYRAFNPTLKPVGLNSSTCLFDSIEIDVQGCSYEDGWKCYQQGFEEGPGPTGGNTPGAIQCSPEKE